MYELFQFKTSRGKQSAPQHPNQILPNVAPILALISSIDWRSPQMDHFLHFVHLRWEKGASIGPTAPSGRSMIGWSCWSGAAPWCPAGATGGAPIWWPAGATRGAAPRGAPRCLGLAIGGCWSRRSPWLSISRLEGSSMPRAWTKRKSSMTLEHKLGAPTLSQQVCWCLLVWPSF